MRFFRDIITIVAGLVAILLAVALAAPYVIDWNAQRSNIVGLLERATGAKITVAGDIDLKLLPSPKLRLGDVTIAGAGPGAPQMKAALLHMELGLTPLMRGQFRFVDATLDRAQLRLTIDPEGGFALPPLPDGRPDQVAFERVVFRNAQIVIARDKAAPLELRIPLLDASGQSLSGPFRGSGVFRHGATEVPFAFNTGAAEADNIRFKLSTEAAGALPHSEFDAAFAFRQSAVGNLVASVQGKAVLSGSATLPGGMQHNWRVTGPIAADARGFKVDEFELRAGEDLTSLAMTGSLDVRFHGKPHGVLKLATQQINADVLLGGGAGSRSMRRLAEFLRDALGISGLRNPANSRFDVHFSTPALILGGDALSDLAVDLSFTGDRAIDLGLRTGAPGSSVLNLSGKLETGIAPVFRGVAEFATRDMRRLQAWLEPGWPDAGRLAGGMPYRSFRLAGKVDVSKAGFSGRELEIEAGRSKFVGAVIYTGAIGKERARLHVDINAPQLDIDGVNDIAAPGRALGEADLFLAFDAKAVRLARFGSGMIDAGNISVRLERSRGVLKLERLEVKNLGGATVSARGGVSAGDGRLSIEVDAKNLVELAGLVQRVAPGPWPDILAARAASLSPARARIDLRGLLAGGASAPVLTGLAIEGTFNGTRVTADGKSRDGTLNVDGAVMARNPKAPVLLRQLGLETIAIDSAGEGRIEARWTGGGKGGAQSRIRINAAGTDIAFDGTVRALAPRADLRGKLAIKSADAGPLMQAIAYALPDAVMKAPVDLTGDVAWSGPRISAGNVRGAVLGAKVAGTLVFAPMALDDNLTRHVLTGELRLDRLALRDLASLALGPMPEADGLWSAGRFRSRGVDVPMAKVVLHAGRLDLPGDIRGNNARFTLALSTGLMKLEDLSLRIADAQIGGTVSLRKDRETAALSGALTFETTAALMPGVQGKSKGTLEFAATGASEQALVSGLAGSGSVLVKDFRIDATDTRALSRVIAAAGAERLEISEDKILAALAKEFSRGSLAFAQKRFAIGIAGGVARLETEPAKGLPGGVDANVMLVVNLRDLAREARIEIIARERPSEWNGPTPSLSLVRRADGKGATATIAASGLVNGLSARAILREAARVEALEFDIRERTYFNRRTKLADYLKAREGEITAWRDEQARLAEEARRKAEEEARKAEEARKREEERLRREREAAIREAERKAAEEHRREAERIRREQEADARRAAREKAATSSPQEDASPDKPKPAAPIELKPPSVWKKQIERGQLRLQQ